MTKLKIIFYDKVLLSGIYVDLICQKGGKLNILSISSALCMCLCYDFESIIKSCSTIRVTLHHPNLVKRIGNQQLTPVYSLMYTCCWGQS